MTKTSVLYYILIILTIETIICSNIHESNTGIIHDDEKAWYPSVDDAYELEPCQNKCNKIYGESLSDKSKRRLRNCKLYCKKLTICIKKCRDKYKSNEDAFQRCIKPRCNQLKWKAN
ncbi:hypothetical protein PIB30_005893 [Stylosanthes scabra]|uniref:Uncharacterized protein n=1 Tax=Stylosanthes scabra TaxID=79078 RepID=A0ABU6Q512_9FABA|nr:hypothetical protein [Stylosanthes scabra]